MVVRDPQHRSDRVLRIWSVGSAQLVGSEARQLGDSTLAMPFAYVGGRVDVDVRPCLAGRADVPRRRFECFPACQQPCRGACFVCCWFEVEREPCAHVATDAVSYHVVTMFRCEISVTFRVLPRPPQSYGAGLRHVFEVYSPPANYLPRGIIIYRQGLEL